MADQQNLNPNGLEHLELSDLLSFNSQVSKLVDAGVPIRFQGAPSSMGLWLQGISNRVAVNVGLGDSPAVALSKDPSVNSAYLSALTAWQASREGGSSNNTDDQSLEGAFEALDPWVRSGIAGDRQVDKSSVYAFWLWLVALMASMVMIHSAWTVFPKLKLFYQNSGFEIGGGYLWLKWIYDRLVPLGLSLAMLLALAPLVWRLWFNRIVKHRILSNVYSRGFFLAYLAIGGLMTAVVGWTVFWPMVELLIQVGEPRP